MRIAFVNSWNQALSWFFYSQGMSSPPYGMCQAAARLAERGNEVVVFDGQMLREDAECLARRVLDWGPDLVLVGVFPQLHLHTFMGVSAFPYDAELCRELRAKRPNLSLVIGGYIPALFGGSALAESGADRVATSIGDLEPIVKSDPVACERVLGPATAVDAYDFLVPSILKYGVDRNFYLDDAVHDTRPVLPVMTAIGCPHRCTFCATPAMFAGEYSARSVGAAVDEIEAGVRKYGIRSWSVWDDTFTVDAARVRAFCESILIRGLDIRWWCFGHARWIGRHPDLLPLMHQAGCRMMWVGVESTDEDRMTLYHKGICLHEGMAAVKNLVRAGILPTTSFIFGEPDDTRASIVNRVSASQHFATAGSLNIYTMLIPVPGTALFDELAATGRIMPSDLRLFSGVRSVLRYHGLEPAILEELFFETYVSSILSGRWIESFGRANLWQHDPGSGMDVTDVERLKVLARAEFARMQGLGNGGGIKVDACSLKR